MGIRGELFTIQVPAENRTYFFNVKENTRGNVFLQVVESKAADGLGFDRHAIVVFEDEMRLFLQGLDKCIEFIEKNRKEKYKAKAKKNSELYFSKDKNTGKQNPDKPNEKKIKKIIKKQPK